MTNTTYENAGSFEPTDADWMSLDEGFQEMDRARTLRDLAASFEEVVAGKRKLNDQDHSLIEMLTGVLQKAHLAAAVDTFATKLAEGQDFSETGAMRQLEDRARLHQLSVESASTLTTQRTVEASFARETVLLWASLDAAAFLALTDPKELVSAAHQIAGNFDRADGRYGRALYDVNAEVFDTVSLMYGELMDASQHSSSTEAVCA
jgi:hypothetical protein